MSLPEPNVAPPPKPNILQQETLNVPNWVWLLVIAAGIGAAIFIPRLFSGASNSATDASTTSDNLGNTGGLPVGGDIGAPPDYSSQLNQIQTTLGNLANGNGTGGINGQGTNSRSVKWNDYNTPVLPVLTSEGGHTYVIANSFPYAFSTFADIARRLGLSVTRLEQLNPGVDPHHIQFNEKLRIS